MNRSAGNKRAISAHRLPVNLPLPRSHRSIPPAAFVAQLLGSATAPEQTLSQLTREEQVVQRYRLIEASDKRRIPAGYRKSVSA